MTRLSEKKETKLRTENKKIIRQSELLTRKKNIPFLVQWFNGLTIRKKQLTALITSELITVVGLMGVGSLLILTNGRSQLENQAKSELVVTEINYNIKIDQMGFGFRGQSDNVAIINGVKNYNQTGKISPNLEQEIKQILRNEIKARNIEYATLVGKDLKIIVNANNNRQGEIFNPNNLVSQVITNPEQIKTSEIVNWQELQNEKPPLPANFSQSDALIRYTITPIQDKTTNEVLGVLVSGDIVNNKYAIVEKTIDAFGSGYSAVYQVNNNGEIKLTASNLRTINNQNSKENIPLSENQILETAIKRPGEIVNNRTKIEGNNYTLAAQLIKNSNNQPVAILVRGTEENFLNDLLNSSLQLQLIIVAAAILINVIIALILGKVIANPVEKLTKTAEQFAEGNLGIRTNIETEDEVGELATTFNKMAENIEANELRILTEQEETQLLSQISNYNIRGKKDLQKALEQVFPQIIKYLNIDRILIMEIPSPTTLKIFAEGVNLGVDNLKNTKPEILNIPQELMLAYQKGRLLVNNNHNIIKSGFFAEHEVLMNQFKVTTNLVIPINLQDKTEMLLMAQYCEQNYSWSAKEITFLKQLTNQLAIIIERYNFLEQQKLAELKQKQEKEQLQQKALTLSSQVASVAKGDLTVKAAVTADEIGTIAKSYNSTIESLRKLVGQVIQAAEEVNQTTVKEENTLQNLRSDSQQQTETISAMVEKINQLNESIFLVALNAAQAEVATQKTVKIVASGDQAMNRTVENILNLKNTVIDTEQKVNQLGVSSKKITKVIALISKFAAQTHLLALKASIEAARSGEQGQGFAVIADEVRNLATQSSEATEQIEIIVAEIQNEIMAVAMNMAKGSKEVEQGTQLVAEAKEKLNAIQTVTQEINQLIETISANTQEQSQDSDSITEYMGQVTMISQNSSLSVLEVLKAFNDIQKVSQQLQETVSKFTLNK